VDNSDQQLLARQLSSDVGRIQTDSRKVREKDPRKALQMLEQVRAEVEKSQLDDQYRRQLLSRVDGAVKDTENYIEEHRAELEQDERNREVLDEIDRRSKLKLQMQSKIAEMVNQFNQLRDEERYAEMQQVAQRLYEMAPDEPVVQQVWQNAKFIHRQRQQAT